jgi:hypothetical protein
MPVHRPRPVCRGRACHRSSRSCSPATGTIGTPCRPSASRRLPAVASAGSECHRTSVTSRVSVSTGGIPCHGTNKRPCASGGKNSRRSHPMSSRRYARTFTASNSSRRNSAANYASAGITPAPHSGSRCSSRVVRDGCSAAVNACRCVRCRGLRCDRRPEGTDRLTRGRTIAVASHPRAVARGPARCKHPHAPPAP